jgi:hypothetical protein
VKQNAKNETYLKAKRKIRREKNKFFGEAKKIYFFVLKRRMEAI